MSRSSSRSQTVAEAIRSQIAAGKIPAGSLLPAERILQAQFDVSRTTLRRALAEVVASGWAESVPNRGVMARMGSVKPRSNLVAFVDHTDWIHKSFFFYLSQTLHDRGLYLVHVDSKERGTLGALEYAVDSGFAAAVFWGKEIFVDRQRLDALKAKLAVVAVDHRPEGAEVDVVMGDHFGGAQLAVEHLIRMGRREIAVSGFLTMVEDTQKRLLGYMSAIYAGGLAAQAHNLVFSAPAIAYEEEPRLLRHRLTESDRPDAVFVFHDMSAPVVASAIMDEGLSIPDDVAVVGFGNDLPFTLGEVGLTTVGLDWRQIAVAVADRVESRISDPNGPVSETILPAHLVVRGSCGAPRGTWSDEEYQVSSATVTRRMAATRWSESSEGGLRPPLPKSFELDPK